MVEQFHSAAHIDDKEEGNERGSLTSIPKPRHVKKSHQPLGC